MVSHDVAAMRQTAHRLVYLEETIDLTVLLPISRALRNSPLAGLRTFMGDITTTTLLNIAVEESTQPAVCLPTKEEE